MHGIAPLFLAIYADAMDTAVVLPEIGKRRKERVMKLEVKIALYDQYGSSV